MSLEESRGHGSVKSEEGDHDEWERDKGVLGFNINEGKACNDDIALWRVDHFQ